MKKSIIIFIMLTFVAKIFAFGRELVLSNYYGADAISDVFILSMTIPVTIFGFISSGVVSGVIPIYYRVDREKGKVRALLFCSQITNLIIGVCFVFVVGYFLFSEQLLRMFAIGFSETMMRMAIRFTDISVWAIISIALSSIYTSYLQINNKINITAISQIPQNIGLIITILIAIYTQNSLILPIGFLISSFAQTFFLLWFSVKGGYIYSFSISLNDEYVKMFLSGLGMLTISSSILQINTLIDRTLATKVMVGGLSLFEYAGNINNLFMGFTIIPISTALYPQMTKSIQDNEAFSKILFDGVKIFIIVMIPLVLYICCFSYEIVNILYGRGAFGERETQLTSGIVIYYGIGLIAFAIRELFTKAYYAFGDVKTPMVNAAVALVLNVFLNLILVNYMGLNGLAFATSVSAYVMMFLLWRPMKKKIKICFSKREIKIIVISVIASILSTVISRIAYVMIFNIISQIFSIIVASIIFGILYFVISLLLGNIRFAWVKDLFTNK